jgi:phenylalanyl-tRNA synthetase beta chain
VAVFELARVYLPPLSPLPTEERRLVIAMAGRRSPESWGSRSDNFDFFDLRAAVEAAMRALHAPVPTFTPATAPWLHPSRGASVRVARDGPDLGQLGQVHPRVAERFGVEGVELYAAEIDLGALLTLAREELEVRGLPRFPAVERDLAFILPESATHEEVLSAIRSAAGPLLEETSLFDVYHGSQVPPGHRSLAYSMRFRASDRTLTDDEVTSAVRSVEEEVTRRYGAQVRGR